MENFDWIKYTHYYTDLNHITSKKNAWLHWINHGKMENRQFFYLVNEKNDNDMTIEVFDWKKYSFHNKDIQHKVHTKESAWNHWKIYGKIENREFFYIKNENKDIYYDWIPDFFDWQKYLLINKDVGDNYTTKEGAWYHWFMYGEEEKRPFYYLKSFNNNQNDVLFLDFNWKSYLLCNTDVSNIYTTKEGALYHFLNYGIHENRIYKIDNNILFDLMLIKNNKLNYDIYNICCYILKIQKSIIENENIEIFKYPLQTYQEHREFSTGWVEKDYLNNSNYSVSNNVVDNQPEIRNIDYKDTEFCNIYETFILILDLPETYTGGSKFFINEIITTYSKDTTFLILRNKENNVFQFNINNKYLFPNHYDYNSAVEFIQTIKHKIKKIFVNHTYGFPPYFMKELFNLQINISTITHDHFLWSDNPHLLYPEINQLVETNFCKYNINSFDTIITQNKHNLYLFKNDIKNVIICDLPDYKCSDEIIHTNNEQLVIGIIGAISDVKGSSFVYFLIEYLKKTDIKIVIFGKINGIPPEHCYPYKNIIELNNLLKTHKPNLLLETSLWPETYSYTLTLCMLTELPILSLKKPFQSVVENRLQNYEKTHYFKNFQDFLFLINNTNQSYFKTIKPTVYLNSFWDTFFLDKNKNSYFIENNENILDKIKNTIQKNVVLITSKIYISDNKFSYAGKRSIYDIKTRYQQTLHTINTVKKHIPNSFIILFDNSNFTEEEKTELHNMSDCFINITNNDTLNYFTNICEYKYLSDMCQQIYCYLYFLRHIDFGRIKHFFKISGRYYINDTFTYSEFDNSLNLFKKAMNIKDKNYYYTSFFKLSNAFLEEYFLKLMNIFENRGDFFNLDLEVIYSIHFSDNITLKDKLGITQIFSCWNKINDI